MELGPSEAEFPAFNAVDPGTNSAFDHVGMSVAALLRAIEVHGTHRAMDSVRIVRRAVLFPMRQIFFITLSPTLNARQ
jgi:hypothetical protein